MLSRNLYAVYELIGLVYQLTGFINKKVPRFPRTDLKSPIYNQPERTCFYNCMLTLVQPKPRKKKTKVLVTKPTMTTVQVTFLMSS